MASGTIPGEVLVILKAMMYVSIVMPAFWYRAWACVQDGHARTTPGKAVGFMLIPIFYVLGMFQGLVNVVLMFILASKLCGALHSLPPELEASQVAPA